MNKKRARFILTIFSVMAFTMVISESETEAGRVSARGAKRQVIKSQHILDRNYRPLHVYGNTVRRRHSRRR